MKIAVSYTSIENARNNLTQECTTWDFEQVRDKSLKIWDESLSKINVSGGAIKQRVKFYTDLWHVLLGRHKINDISGDYPDRTTGTRKATFTDANFLVKKLPLDNTGKPKFNMYNSDAWWLTQWNLNVLCGLAWPEVMDEMSASMIEYAKNGYLLPRGPCGGGYSYIMTSCPAVNLIASSIQKNLLTKASIDDAYKVMKQNLLPGGMLGDAEDIEFYTEKTYWPNNAGISLEASFQDFAMAQVAKKLGKNSDYDFFSKRSKGWTNLYNPKLGLIFPKDKNGSFMHEDPLSGSGWIEANAWQGTWSVSQDIEGLAKLMGGENILCKKLNYAFEQAEPSDFVFAYNDGYVSYANQPGCSNAHVFNYAGKPWLTQYWVRKVQEKAYGGTSPDLGYGGHDEDQGQMGGISSLMSIGLFSIKGNVDTEPTYEITSPIFDRIEITLDKRYYSGDSFVIRTKNNLPDYLYIRSSTLNGKSHNKFWFKHSDFQKGGELIITLDKEPNKNWGKK